MSAVPPENDGVSLLQRSFALLRAFREQSVLGVSELSRATGIPRSSVHRLTHVGQTANIAFLARSRPKYSTTDRRPHHG